MQQNVLKTHLAHGIEKTEYEAQYDELKKVYSIWIFFEAPERDSDTITEYHLTKKDVYGKPVEGGKYDYLSISFIRLSTGKKWNSKDKLINMLDTLFSNRMDAADREEACQGPVSGSYCRGIGRRYRNY